MKKEKEKVAPKEREISIGFWKRLIKWYYRK